MGFCLARRRIVANPHDRGEVRQRLLSLNRDTAPYQIIDGASQNVDLIAEWKIVDAKWYEILQIKSHEGLPHLLKFDVIKNEGAARRRVTVSWRAACLRCALSE